MNQSNSSDSNESGGGSSDELASSVISSYKNITTQLRTGYDNENRKMSDVVLAVMGNLEEQKPVASPRI